MYLTQFEMELFIGLRIIEMRILQQLIIQTLKLSGYTNNIN